MTRQRSRTRIAQRLQRSSGALSTQALTRMDREMPWFADLPADDRSWIGLIVQAGIKSFVEWFRHPEPSEAELRSAVFGAAPRAMAGTISLEQTVALIRLSIEVVEQNALDLVEEGDAEEVRASINAYAREVAFATAEIYARQAEQRGAWDARLEALVVDAILRGDPGEDIVSRASALGWHGTGHAVVMVGALGDGPAIEVIREVAGSRGLDCLVAVHGDRLVAVLGGIDALGAPAADLIGGFGDGPVVVGPVTATLADAGLSAQAALAGLRAASGWAQAPRPVSADDLLPERALDGDHLARAHLVTDVFTPLLEAGPAVLDTVTAYLDGGSSVEATARALFVHANTVRYRLRGAQEATGLSPTDPREAFTLRVALTIGRLAQKSAQADL